MPVETAILDKGNSDGETDNSTLVLDNTIEKLSSLVFCGTENIKEVRYIGKREEFKTIRNWVPALHWTSCEYVKCSDGNVFVPDVLIENRKLISVKKNAATIELSPNSYDSIAPDAFFGASLREVDISNNVRCIPDGCFGMSDIEKVFISEGCKLFQSGAFDSSEVKEIVFADESKPFFERGAITNCNQLRKLTIPGQFDKFCIENCELLEEIVVTVRPDKNITSFARNCPAVKKISLPISKTDFYKLTSGLGMLTCIPHTAKIVFEDGTEIENAHFGISENKLIAVNKYLKDFTATSASSPIKAIDGMAFNHHEALKTADLSETQVETIPYAAWAGCISLKHVALPNSIKVLEPEIFWDTPRLTELTFSGTVEEWNRIEKDSSWASGSNIKITHCSDGDIEITSSEEEEIFYDYNY